MSLTFARPARRAVALAAMLLVAMTAANASTMFNSSFEPIESLVPSIGVNTSLAPPLDEVPGLEGQPPRPIARFSYDIGSGGRFDFVANEVYLISDDPAELDELQSRWPATVLLDDPLGNPDDPGDTTRLYLLRVDASGADTSRVEEDFAVLGLNLLGTNEVSSEAALELLAMVASERTSYGLRVGINAILAPDDYDLRVSEESDAGVALADGPLTFGYDPNAFTWPFLKREAISPSDFDFPLDTGAADAVRAVAAAGRLHRSVPVTIFDAGFYPNKDFPPYTIIGPARRQNDWPCSGSDSPPAPGSNCATHGTHVVLTGFGRSDNQFGTFAPGGAVADLQLIQSPSIAGDLDSFVRYARRALGALTADPPRIINISAGATIPGEACLFVCEPLDEVVKILRSEGVVIVSSAGNAGLDVDRTEEFCFGFICVEEEADAFIPCETEGVLCIGATTSFRSVRTGYSNFGSSGDDGNSVDLYAPGNLYSVDALAADVVNETPNDDLQAVFGTSYAAPFSAGVLALTMAANPALTTDEAVACLLGTAFRPFAAAPDYRSINALGAVSCALGDTHPFVSIRTPVSGSSFVRGQRNLPLLAQGDDYEDGTRLPVRWTSSIDGELADGTTGVSSDIGIRGLTAGEHEICAEVSDAGGRSDSDCVTVRILNAEPEAIILQPNEGASFFQSDEIILEADVQDLDDSGSHRFEWKICEQFFCPETPDATGRSARVPASPYEPGRYLVELRVVDDDGAHDFTVARINIKEDPPNLPPTVTITSPESGATSGPNDPNSFLVEATAEDPEDGSIPFSEIEWWISREDGPFEQVELRALTLCTGPPFNICNTLHYLDVEPVAGKVETEITIQGRVTDSAGQPNNAENSEVTVFVQQLI